MPRKVPEKQCPIDYALTAFGDRWTLLIVRDMLLGGKRHYQELIAAREGIASNILAARLKKLEKSGFVIRRSDPDDRRKIVYGLTDKAIDLVPVLLEISRWSVRHDPHTAAPADLVKRFDDNRAKLVQELTAAARSRQA